MNEKAGKARGFPDPRAELGWLRAFVAVARAGGVARAARLLDRTQPTVSTRLASLERVWGVRLFRRGPRGVSLTPEGSRLLPRAEAALRDLEELDRLAGVPVSPSGLLRLGAGDALGRIRLPRALARLEAERHGVEVLLREGAGPALLEELRNGDIDLALVVLPGAGQGIEGIDTAPLLESAIRVLSPPGLLERGRRTVTPRALGRCPLVSLHGGSAFRRHVEAAFSTAGVPYRPVVEVGNLSLVRRFVAAGLGAAPVPAVAFDGEPAGAGVERRTLTRVPPVVYHRAVRAGAPLPDTAPRLLDLLAR